MKVQHIAQPKQTPWGWQVDVTYVNDTGMSCVQACCYRDKIPAQKQIDADVAVALTALDKAEDAAIEAKLAPVKNELAAVRVEKAEVERQLAEAIAVKEKEVIRG